MLYNVYMYMLYNAHMRKYLFHSNCRAINNHYISRQVHMIELFDVFIIHHLYICPQAFMVSGIYATLFYSSIGTGQWTPTIIFLF